MCLQRVTKSTFNRPLETGGFGWKVFYRTRAGNLTPVAFRFDTTRYTIGEWYYSSEPFHWDLRYAPRFHIYKHRADAWWAADREYYPVRRVEYWEVVATGKQEDYHSGETVVASYMRIVPTKEDNSG